MRICFIGLAVSAALSFSGCTTPPQNSAQNSPGQLDACFPTPPKGLPFEPFRTNLYTASELLKGYDTNAPDRYYSTPDWQSYLYYKRARQSKDAGKPDEIALRYTRLHDLSIEEALDKWVNDTNQSGPKKVVGIMGGHEMERRVHAPGSTNYSDYMNVVLLARELTINHFTVLTAGGPGVMEAANLGAWMAGYPESNIVEAVNTLATVPDSTNSAQWLRPAVMVKMHYSDPNGNSNSIGVPTWFYGFEPPNPFATHIAKYFENSLREDHLLAISKNGIVFARGSAGTVQEIFQSACQNYYKSDTNNRCPMILLGANYWNRGADSNVDPRDKPAWPLLQQLGRETNFVQQLFISDDIHAIAEFIRTNSVNQTRP